jgi:MFS transporter, UMF1 family
VKIKKDTAKRSFLIFSWSLYDLANQFFALNVVSFYFARWIILEKDVPEIFYSLSFGISMLLVAALAPFLGTVSDIRGRHKPYLIVFTLLAVIFTLFLGFIDNVFLALALFAVANFGCQEAIMFYNSLLPKISPPEKIGLFSGVGKMFGYLGAILALYLTKPILLEHGYQATFVFTAALFFIFSLPCLIFIREKQRRHLPRKTAFVSRKTPRAIIKRIKRALVGSHRLGSLAYFLKAAFFGLCVLNVFILFMATYSTRVFGLSDVEMAHLLMFSTVFAVAGSFFSGLLSDYLGYRRSLIGIFLIWGLCILGAAFLDVRFLWFIGALVGTALGSTWVVSRALIINLVPRERIGEAFGLFNLVGYSAAIVGPVFWGLLLLPLAGLGEAGYRISFLSLLVLIGISLFYFMRMPKEQ